MGPKPKRFSTRFWKCVDASAGLEGCWPWTGKRNAVGYGLFFIATSHGCGAHRASWQLNVGPIPNGMLVLHRCDNPPCVNPRHLFIGTQYDNVQDAKSKGRTRSGSRPKEYCGQGHAMTGSNIYLWRGTRGCQACIKIRSDARPRTGVKPYVPSATCRRGHALTPENTYAHGKRRYCKTCRDIQKQNRLAGIAVLP